MWREPDFARPRVVREFFPAEQHRKHVYDLLVIEWIYQSSIESGQADVGMVSEFLRSQPLSSSLLCKGLNNLCRSIYIQTNQFDWWLIYHYLTRLVIKLSTTSDVKGVITNIAKENKKTIFKLYSV